MSLKFRLKGLAETFVDEIACPNCGMHGVDDQNFSTDLTRVTFEGIIIVVQCKSCGEIFVPKAQRLGIIDSSELARAVKKDSLETGEPIMPGFESVCLNAEKLNAERKGDLN